MALAGGDWFCHAFAMVLIGVDWFCHACAMVFTGVGWCCHAFAMVSQWCWMVLHWLCNGFAIAFPFEVQFFLFLFLPGGGFVLLRGLEPLLLLRGDPLVRGVSGTKVLVPKSNKLSSRDTSKLFYDQAWILSWGPWTLSCQPCNLR